MTTNAGAGAGQRLYPSWMGALKYVFGHMGSGEGASLTVPPESWKSDRRVRHLLERNMDKDEHIRFVIEGMEGQCIVALDERLLVIKPGSAADPHYSGLVTSITLTTVTLIA
jgi:hypothetical protein